MGQTQSIQKINFEDIQYVLKNHEQHVLINTLGENEQHCLLPNTINARDEENIINKLIKNGRKDIKIIIYGKNCNDEKIYTKHTQLISLGFYNVFIYTGGLFEWLLLQDIYGKEKFQTTSKTLDLLKYKPPTILNTKYLTYSWQEDS